MVLNMFYRRIAHIELVLTPCNCFSVVVVVVVAAGSLCWWVGGWVGQGAGERDGIRLPKKQDPWS